MAIEINTHCNKCNDQTTTLDVSLREAVALIMQSNRYHVCDDQCIILSYDVCPACQLKAVSKRPIKKPRLVEDDGDSCITFVYIPKKHLPILSTVNPPLK